MRIPITDKFLLDLYNFCEGLERSLSSLIPPRTMKEALFPDIYKLKQEYERRKTKQQVSQLIYYLKKKGYIKIKNLEQKQGVILTRKGIEKVLKIKFKTIEKKKRPDGKWQMVIFDIPEKKRHLRDLLRENLYLLGYKMLQRSIWVSPYDVFKETESIIRESSLDPYVKLFLIEELEL